jgi:hypothetical protein
MEDAGLLTKAIKLSGKAAAEAYETAVTIAEGAVAAADVHLPPTWER